MADPVWEVVGSYSALYEAEMASSRLESAGIDSHIDQGANAGVFGPGHARPLGGVALYVLADDLEEARIALDLEDEDDDDEE